PDLAVDAPPVLAEDPEADQLDSAEEQDRDEENRPAVRRGTVDDRPEREPEGKQEAHTGQHEAQRRCELERPVGKGEEAVQREAQERSVRVLRRSGEATGPGTG